MHSMRLIPPRAIPFLLFIHAPFNLLSYYLLPSLVHPRLGIPPSSRNDDSSSTISVISSTTSTETLYSTAGVIAERRGYSNPGLVNMRSFRVWNIVAPRVLPGTGHPCRPLFSQMHGQNQNHTTSRLRFVLPTPAFRSPASLGS
jgi:hypothetical protein